MNINTFLNKVKKAIDEGNFEILERKENMVTKRKYGFTTLEQEEMVKQLEPKDLIRGPVLDEFIPSEDVWIFKKKYNGIKVMFYIKLKIRNNKECICLSFHEDKK